MTRRLCDVRSLSECLELPWDAFTIRGPDELKQRFLICTRNREREVCVLYGFKESQPVVFITAKCTRLHLHNPPSRSYSLCKAGLLHTCLIMRFPGTAQLWYSEHPGMVIFHEGLKKNRVRKCSLIKLWRKLFKTTFIKNQTQWCYSRCDGGEKFWKFLVI